MTVLGVLLCLLALVGLVLYKVLHNQFEGKLDRMRINARRKVERGDLTEKEVDDTVNAERFFLPSWASGAFIGVFAVGFLLASFNGMFFYAEPTFKYHIRPIWGGEKVVSGETGYRIKGFGRKNEWKIAMSVQATPRGGKLDDVSNAESATSISANLPTQNIVFLDQVDSAGSATVRFRLPDDEIKFLELVHDFRSPENFLNTELIPAFKETFQATGSLMAAEEYFSGGRTDFNNEFANQMDNGIYLVRRIQVFAPDAGNRQASADASAIKQDDYEDDGKVVFKVEKRLDSETALPLRKIQKFKDYGVTVVSARVTDMVPNEKFRLRMEAKQDASAKRAVNREERIQEEEQKFLAIATGERQIAEEQASARKVQIKKTTDAETTKRLALIVANQKKQEAAIEKETAQIQLEKAEIDAKRKERLAEADKYEREARIAGDNALQQKLDAIVEMNRDIANALAKRQVPTTVVYQGGGDASESGMGTDGDVRTVLQTQMLKNLKALDLDLGLTAPATTQ